MKTIKKIWLGIAVFTLSLSMGYSVQAFIYNPTGGVSGLTSGSIPFSTGAMLSQDNTNFFWDNTAKQLRIGGTGSFIGGNSQIGLSVASNNANYYGAYFQNKNNGSSASTDIVIGADNDTTTIAGHYADFGIQGSGYVGANVGVIKTISINAAGSGYTAGDLLSVTGGNSDAQLTVSTVDGSGHVTAIAIFNNGTGYTVTNFATTGGTGTGFRVNVLTLFDYTAFSGDDVYSLAIGGNYVIGTDDTVAGKTVKVLTNGFGSSKLRLTISDTALTLSSGTDLVTTGNTTTVANVGANSCGTTAATIVGNDNNGAITVGATAGTQCRVAFATAAPNSRDCTTTDGTTTIATRATFVDSTHTDFLGAFVAGDKVVYICVAR